MNILEFIETYPDEYSCKMDMKEKREKSGITCKKCSSTEHYWLSTRYVWECKTCNYRTSLKSGTVMESSNLSLRIWYLAIALMNMTKKGISAHEMKRQLGMKRYEPVWSLMHKIRSAMGQRDNKYILEGMVELDEAYISKSTRANTKLKRGKGSQRKQNVVVMAESTPLEDIVTGANSSHCRYYKMKILDSHKSESIESCVEQSLDEKTFVLSDKSNTYNNLSDYIEGHVTELSDPVTTNTTLRWVHIAISNVKRNLLGIYHKISGAYLQNYLNEFCYKLNRRYFGDRLFDRVIIAIANSSCKKAD